MSKKKGWLKESFTQKYQDQKKRGQLAAGLLYGGHAAVILCLAKLEPWSVIGWVGLTCLVIGIGQRNGLKNESGEPYHEDSSRINPEHDSIDPGAAHALSDITDVSGPSH